MGETATTTHVLVFLFVAKAAGRKEQIEVLDVAKALKLSSASTSRNLSAIGDWHWRQKPGAGLIRLVPMLSDRRRKLVQLTKAGAELARKLEDL